MSRRIGRRVGHGSRRMFVTGDAPLTDYTTYRPAQILHKGITRAPDRTGRAASLPLSDRHEVVLAALTDEPQGATALAAKLGLTREQVNTAAYGLAARGLAMPMPGKGWRRT